MIIEAENLTKRFKRNDAVLGVNLAIPEGSAFAIIGANGAGKTTTLRMFVNLLQPDEGSVRVLGVDSKRLSPLDFTRIGYVAESQVLPEGLAVEQFLDYLRVLYPNWDRALETELCAFFELPRRQPIGKLSHGTRMKVKLVAGLSFRPKVLILDEPLSGLDPLVRDEVMAGILRQAAETTLVISSHEIAEIERCVTHVAFMSAGTVVRQHSIDDLGQRFREVTVTTAPERAATVLPKTWVASEARGSTCRFVETDFQGDSALQSAVADHFGSGVQVDAQPMSLRDIAKALLRASRTEQLS